MFFFSKKAERIYTEAVYTPDCFLVFGKETQGLPEEILKEYRGNTFQIPMWGKTRSLNLSTAAGIVLYEAYRQIGFND
jgi:tRNA (cytidine/uridine-2'-O-)-methyltransferase